MSFEASHCFPPTIVRLVSPALTDYGVEWRPTKMDLTHAWLAKYSCLADREVVSAFVQNTY